MTTAIVPSPAPNLITIVLGGGKSTPYKSIDDLAWENLPNFAILTGLNGGGKSQLLEVLAYGISNTHHPRNNQLLGIDVTVIGDTFGADDVAYVPASGTFSNDMALGVAQIQDLKSGLYDQLQEHNVRANIQMRGRRARLQKFLNVDRLENVSKAEFIKRLPDDYAFMLEDEDVVAGLVHVFVAYRLRFAERLEKGETRDAIIKDLGQPPWEVVNKALEVADFPYRVTSPWDSKLAQPYRLMLADGNSGLQHTPGDLSSGEKVILQLVLWLYNSRHHNRFPRLFLLDEPDARLHPSMTRQFMDVLQEVLVRQFGVRVILTTHSPSTVALAPEGSVFEMSRTAPRIRPSPSKAHTIGLLTAGLVTVFPSTRFVLVEDELDVDFYSVIRDILTDFGPSRDPRALKPEPTIVFLPASSGQGAAKTGGGKSVVCQWTEKFEVGPLAEMFRGIIDLDSGGTPPPRVSVLSRYSLENYLLDPLTVYGLLLEEVLRRT